MIETPYLLYIGNVTEALAAKTARGIAAWRPDVCVGQFRSTPLAVSVGLPDMSIQEAAARGAKTMVLGIANAGGVMSDVIVGHVIEALEAGLNVANGLHQRLSLHPQIQARAEQLGLGLFDVREPPKDLKVASGKRRSGRRLLTVGTDCAVGKMYTTLALERELLGRGVPAVFRATGQTGILIAGSGIPIDAVVADFISGAAEQLSPERNDPSWDLIEGQGSLFHPSYAGVSLGLLHGSQPDALVICHETGRTRIRHLSEHVVPSIELTIERNLEAARLTSPDVLAVGIALNTSALRPDERLRVCEGVERQTGLPCQDPVAMGVDRIATYLLERFP